MKKASILVFALSLALLASGQSDIQRRTYSYGDYTYRIQYVIKSSLSYWAKDTANTVPCIVNIYRRKLNVNTGYTSYKLGISMNYTAPKSVLDDDKKSEALIKKYLK
jgi:hypothetical protein